MDWIAERLMYFSSFLLFLSAESFMNKIDFRKSLVAKMPEKLSTTIDKIIVNVYKLLTSNNEGLI